MTTPEVATSKQNLFSTLMLIVASISIAGACFLSNPQAFSDAHQKDQSLLKSVVSFLGLANAAGDGSAFPTLRGVEVRALCFNVGAAALMLLFGAQLLTRSGRPRMTIDDLYDFKRHFKGPYIYWALLLFVSLVTSYAASEARDVSLGGVLLRFLTFGWWLPLAVALRPIDARRLSAVMTLLVTLMALFGIWYFFGRPDSRHRLWYPVGNELWFGACLLPAIFVAAGAILAGLQRRKAGDANAGQRIDLVVMGLIALAVCVYALWLTKSRSAAAGLYAGACFSLILMAPKKRRALVLLVALLVAFGVIQLKVMPMLKHSAMGDRAHSIRSRLNHEWPYAIHLWQQKIVGGHGEGGYTMQAGKFAREDQLFDPNAIAIDEQVWVAEAHNEYLNLLSDVGLAGTIGFVGALVVTLVWSIRFVDRKRDDSEAGVSRCFVIGLAGAVVAVAFEEGASVALRHPGLPPLFFTTWACLWAIIRSERPLPEHKGDAKDYEERRLGASTVRLGGAVAIIAGLGLSFVSVQDWRGARDQYEARTLLSNGEFEKAITLADESGMRQLDPMRKLVSREMAIEARVLELLRRVKKSMTTQTPPSDDDLRFAEQATIEAASLSHTAPRFLQLSKWRWQLALARRDAHMMRNEQADAAEFHKAYIEALNECRLDEPFNIDYLFRLWGEVGEPAPQARLEWLCLWLRRNHLGEDPRFGIMLEILATQIPGFGPVMDGAVNIATQDAEKPIDEWQDPFSPETLRIAAAISDAQGDPARAADFSEVAATMYAAAGGKLFYGHSAALLENTHYRFRIDPGADPKPLLETLLEACQIMDGPIAGSDDPLKTPLPRIYGQFRLPILLAAGREEEARKQIELLTRGATISTDTQMAMAYAQLANQFAMQTKLAPLVAKWASRAEALDPAVIEATFARLRMALARGNDDAALAAAKRIIEQAPDRKIIYRALIQAELEKPESGIWKVLRETYSDFPKSQRQATTQPANALEGVPDVSELPNETTRAAGEGSSKDH
ncbi:MAG TPA: O-antigen ligase family protein [Phycisphaerae bacterium]|nr:O-antigen ligase family protein [Phycisphaerae bacterium]